MLVNPRLFDLFQLLWAFVKVNEVVINVYKAITIKVKNEFNKTNF